MACSSDKNSYLLVEGINDQKFIEALCPKHKVSINFEVCFPGKDGGIEIVLETIPIYLKKSGLEALGIVVDADEDIQACWHSVRSRLEKAQYYDVPKQPPQNGFISSLSNRPRVGVWVMPDNQSKGMLEDFASLLIPQNDTLKPIAEKTLQSIEKKKLNLYPSILHSKALIHTWLAWQQRPGIQMAHAINAQVLLHNQPLANRFVDWLRNLFS